MNDLFSDDLDIYSEDPSVGLPGSSSFLIEENEMRLQGRSMMVDTSYSREQLQVDLSDTDEFPRKNFRSSTPPPVRSAFDEEDIMTRASTAPSPGSPNHPDYVYIPRSASMDGLKPALKKEFSKKRSNLNVKFATIDEFIGEEDDSDDLADIPDLPNLPPGGGESAGTPMNAPPGEIPSSGPPVGAPPSGLPFALPPKVKGPLPPKVGGPPPTAGGPPISFPPKPAAKSLPSFIPPKSTSTALPSFIPPKPTSKSLPSFIPPKPKVIQKEDPDVLKEMGSPPAGVPYASEQSTDPPGPPAAAPPLGLKKLPPKLKTKNLRSPREPPDTAPSPVDDPASNTLVVDGDVQIDNKYLFLGSPRLSANSDGRSQREIRRMSDSLEGLSAMAGGEARSTKKAKGFFEAKAKELKDSTLPRKKKKKLSVENTATPNNNSGSIPLGTRKGIYIRAESGWVKVNSKEGKQLADSLGLVPEKTVSNVPRASAPWGKYEPPPSQRASLRTSISLQEIREQSAVSAKKNIFEKKVKDTKQELVRQSTLTKRPTKKKSGYIRNAKGKWIAPGDKLEDI